jgi:subtilisin family serine protease
MQRRLTRGRSRSTASRPIHCESLETRTLLSAQADVTQLTALRADPNYAGIDGSGVGVAVIDTGVFAGHPDLVGNFVAYFDAVRQPATAAASTDPAAAFDPNGHGTHVAGTAASTNPEIGVATDANLVAIRGLPSPGDPTPQFDTVGNALDWVLNHHQQYNIRVVNMSLGDYTTNFNTVPGGTRPAVFDQLERLGITTVIASGNNYANFATPGSSSPGIFGTLTVANTWPDSGEGESFPSLGGNGNRINFVAAETDAAPDRFAATSQRSTLPNQVAAPGSGILSTWNDPAKPYNDLSGTSMASPFVAGMVALMQDAAFTYGGRYLTTSEVQQIVINSADTIVDGNVASNFRIPVGFDAEGRPFRNGPDQDLPETGLTFKRVNVYRAVQFARQAVTGVTPDPDPNPDPTPGDQGDTNNTTVSAVVVPSLNATERFAFAGRVGTDGSVTTGADDVDLFKVVLDSPGVLTVATAAAPGGTPFDAYLRLFDAHGLELATADNNAADPYPVLTSARLPAGTYYFGVSSVANVAYDVASGGGAANGASQGDYTLTVGLSNPDPNGVAQGATDVALTSPDAISPGSGLPANYFAGAIDSDPDPENPGQRVTIGDTDVDMFRVVAPDSGILTADVNARDASGDTPAPYPTTGVDSYLRVFDADLNQIAAHDDEQVGVRTDSLLQVPVVAGQVYYVAVTTFGNRNFNPMDPFDRSSTTPGAVGLYDLYLSLDNGDFNGTVFEAFPAAVGEAQPGQIGADGGDPVGADGTKDVDFFEFDGDGVTAGLLDVTATSPDGSLSPVLTLWQYDPDANDVVRILDTAGSAAHLIVPLAADATLFVSVAGQGNNDFNWAARASGSGGDTGNYTLGSTLRPQSDIAALTDDSAAGGTPTPVNPGEQLYRTIGVDGGVTIGAADVDLYRFAPAVSGTFAIRAIVPGEQTTDPVLRIFDEQGNELTANDDAGPNTLDASVSFRADAGKVYYIGVNGSSASALAYNPITGAGAAPGDGGDYVLDVSNAIVTFGGKQKAVYRDASGDAVTISLKGPGSGTVQFAGAAAGNADAASIVLDGTTAASSLVILCKGGGTTTGDVTVNGSLKSLTGKTADLTGNLTVAGSIAKLALRSAAGHTITYSGGGLSTFAFGAVADTSINSASTIKSIKATQWLDADATPDTIAAPSVGSVTAKGEFGAGITTSVLLKAKVGTLNGADIRADNSIGTVAAGQMLNSRVFAGVAPTVSALPASLADFANAAATIKAVTVKGTFAGSLVAAPTIGKAALGVVATGNGGNVFGLAADRAKSVSALTPTQRLRLSRLDAPEQSTQEGDFVVRVY